MNNIFNYLEKKKGKPIPFLYKLLYNLLLNENDLIHNGNLNLFGTNITSLPDNLTINGDLNLYGTNISELPNNLTVNGWLYLTHTKITSLPNNLTINGWLYLTHTNISELPDEVIANSNDLIVIDNNNSIKKYK